MLTPIVGWVYWVFVGATQIKGLNQVVRKVQNRKDENQNEVSCIESDCASSEVGKHGCERQKMCKPNCYKGRYNSNLSFPQQLIVVGNVGVFWLLSNHKGKHD